MNCVTPIFNMIGLLFQVITLGGFASPLPILIQGPLLLFFALTWGIIIVKMITNTAAAIIP